MKKKTNKFFAVFNIFFKSIKMYFLYLDKTSKYMLIPVFGQILGLILIFFTTYYYNTNIETIRKIPFFSQSDEHILLGLFIVLLPSLSLFIHSIYRYIIAFCSLNIVFYTLSLKKKAKEIDFKINDNIIERKLFQYVLLLFFVSVLCIFPPLWIVLCLSFQIFSLEKDTNCFSAISRSIKLSLENLIYVLMMLVFVFIFSYWFLPTLFIWALEKISFTDFLTTRVETYTKLLPLNLWNDIFGSLYHIDSVTIAKSITESILVFIIIGFTLPFRCACFSELYRVLDNEKIKEFSKEDEEIIKRSSSKKRKK